TGHCYAVGAEATDRQDNIYLGNTENIAATDFPDIFSYVALGHIHRPQMVGQLNHVRYSGSLIPLSFSETKDDKGVYQLTYTGAHLEDVTFRPLPVFRRLKTIEASPDDAEEKLRRFAARREPGLTPWVEILVEAESVPPQFDMTLRELGAELGVEVLRVRLLRRRAGVLEASLDQELEELDVREVFRERCAAFETDEAMLAELEQSFIELQEWRESDPQP
ncbi:MAG: exonuclease SbcCD subunit D C-terminal domain-containing protein, partial [Lewinellaceae bacterium]|nr:exonuclease SbcCD subunit D C-terminal domain-containing protein [Lewinellaceae bacterium]